MHLSQSTRHEVARFYLDENVSNELRHFLTASGNDVLSTDAAGRKGDSDVRQLVFATQQGRITITHNRAHFSLVHEAWVAFGKVWGLARPFDHPGILVLPQPPQMRTPIAASEIDRLAFAGLESSRIWVWRPDMGWSEPPFAIDHIRLVR